MCLLPVLSCSARELARFDVRSYGAKGDGVSDDGPAIQAAIDAAHSRGGGIVYVPAGTCLLKTLQEQKGVRYYLLNIYSNIELRGDGESKTLLKAGPNMRNQTRVLSTDSSDGARPVVHDVIFQAFTLDGDAT